MNYIKFKEQDSRYIDGLVICELPPITKPPMRFTETAIDGIDGSVIEEVGYQTYDKMLTIGITPKAKIDDVIKFFSGKGDIIFSNEPDKCYKGIIVNQIDYIRLVRFRTATVTFRVQPFKYKYEEIPVDNDVDGVFYVENWGNTTSKPLIRLSGSGTVVCYVNGNSVFSYTFPANDTDVYIDSEVQDAYLGDVLKNRSMMGEFPILQSGINEITFTGTVNDAEILARSRWI